MPSRLPDLALMLALALGGALAGCSGYDDVRARVSETEARLDAVEARLLGLEARLATLEGRGPAPAADSAEQEARLAALEQERADLRTRLDALLGDVAALRGQGRALGSAQDGGARVIEAPGGGLPADGAALEVISVGAGDLLLVRAGGRPRRLALLGVEAPRREADYGVGDEGLALRERHAAALRPGLLGDDGWQASKERLEALLLEGTAHLRLPQSAPVLSPRGVVQAYVELEQDGRRRDLGGLMIRAGYAFPAEVEHALREEYATLGAAAAGEGLGLLRAPAR